MTREHEGYVLIDHRASPGTEEVPEGTVLEAATLHCAHCNTVTIKNPNRIRARASCLQCGNRYVCDNCALEMKMPDYIHNPYNKKLDDYYRKITSNG